MRQRDRTRPSAIAALPYFPWTLTCVALLIAGAFLENSVARAHRIRVEELIDHYDTSLFVPVLFLGGSVLCGIGPAIGEAWGMLRRGRGSWLLLAMALIVVTFGVGHFVEAAGLSLMMSAVLNARARRSAERRIL